MSHNSDLVQICLPTYNGESHLAEALDSLLAQTYRNIEIVIMDNASTDATPRIAQDFARRDNRIRYFRSETFVCAADNWNRAFEKIDPHRSEFFMWAGDDDLWSSNYVERLIQPLIKNRHLVLSFSDYRQIDLAGAIIRESGFEGDSTSTKSAIACYQWLMSKSGGHCAICGIARLSALSWRPPCVDVCFGGDLWFLLRLAANGGFAYSNTTLLSKRLGGISSTGGDASAIKNVEAIWNIAQDEWRIIDALNISHYAKLYIYWRLKILAKLMFPTKPIELYLWPWFAFCMIRLNKYGLGIRSSVRNVLSTKIGPSI